MFYVQLNIGRTVTDQGPLTDTEWETFQADAKDMLVELWQDLSGEYRGAPTVEVHTGGGVWLDHSEESAHLSILIPVGVQHATQAVIMARFNRGLKILARNFSQEAIALITGSKLVKAALPKCHPDHVEDCGV